MKKNSLIIVIPIIICVIAFVLFFVKLGLTGKGIIHLGSMQDFGVSSDGSVFVGYMNKIEVFKNGKFAFSFRPPTSRAYNFYIEDDKIIIGCSPGYTKIYDCNGNFVEDSDLSYNKVVSISHDTKYVSASGEQYKISDGFGFKPFEIKCGEKTILRQNILDYHFNGLPFWLFWAVVFLNMVVLVIALIDKYGFRYNY